MCSDGYGSWSVCLSVCVSTTIYFAMHMYVFPCTCTCTCTYRCSTTWVSPCWKPPSRATMPVCLLTDRQAPGKRSPWWEHRCIVCCMFIVVCIHVHVYVFKWEMRCTCTYTYTLSLYVVYSHDPIVFTIILWEVYMYIVHEYCTLHYTLQYCHSLAVLFDTRTTPKRQHYLLQLDFPLTSYQFYSYPPPPIYMYMHVTGHMTSLQVQMCDYNYIWIHSIILLYCSLIIYTYIYT